MIHWNGREREKIGEENVCGMSTVVFRSICLIDEKRMRFYVFVCCIPMFRSDHVCHITS